MKQPFGKAIDVIGWLIRGILLYYTVIILNFWAYQDGQRNFEPIICAVIIPLSICAGLLLYVESKCKFMLGVLSYIVLTAGISATLSNSWPLLVWMLVPAADVLIGKYYSKRKKDYFNTFRQQCLFRCKKCLIPLCMIPLIGIVDSKVPTADRPLSFQNCITYMSFAFILYLISMIMLNYMNKQYNYFSCFKVINHNIYQKIKRMNAVVATVTIIILGSIMFVVSETVVSIFTRMVGILIFLIFGSSISLLNLIPFSSIFDLFTLEQVDSSSGIVEVSDLVQKRMFTNEFFDYIIYALLIVAVIAICIRLLDQYKKKVVSYAVEDETSDYITKEEIRQFYHISGVKHKVSFPNDYNGKIRKIYFRTINKTLTPEEAKEAQKKTVSELTGVLTFDKPEQMEQAVNQCYEKARYSGKMCEEEDLKNMNEWIR